MRTLVDRPKATQPAASSRFAASPKARAPESHAAPESSGVARDSGGHSRSGGAAPFQHDFSRVPVHHPSASRQLGGLWPNAQETEDVGGRSAGEFIGDVARPVGTFLGNIVGGIAGAVAGNSISSVTTTPPAWNPHGHFLWEVGFNTSGRNGWIVQEMASTRRAQDAAGNALPDRLTRDYWEAWAVDGTGAITPASGATNDTWQRRSFGNHTQGHWSISSSVHFTATDPATQGFAVGNAPEAGLLLSSLTAPTGLGVARLHRYAQGTWDSTGAIPTHTGSCGPQ